jgi:hypothetical protein
LFFVTKKRYRHTLSELVQANSRQRQADKKIETLTKERDDYRAHAEALASSPRIKADTESAFKRGEQHALGKVKYWLVAQFIDHMSRVEVPGLAADVTPKVKINPGLLPRD